MTHGALLAIAAQSSIKRRHGALRAAECGCAQLRAEEWGRKRQRAGVGGSAWEGQMQSGNAGHVDESALVGIARHRAAEDGRERQRPGGRKRKREAGTRRQKSEDRGRDPATESRRERQNAVEFDREKKIEAESGRGRLCSADSGGVWQKAAKSGRGRRSAAE